MSWILRLVVVSLLALPGVARAVEGWPAELSGDGLTVRFASGADVGGVIVRNGQSFAFDGELRDGRIVGAFEAGDDDFDFTLERAGNTFTFKTGSKTYRLAARGQAPAPGEPNARQPSQPAGNGRAVLYVPKVLRDAKSQLDVATLLVPKGWQVNERIIWQVDRSQFITNASSVFDPKSGWGLQLLPFDHFQCLPGAYKSAVAQGGSLFTLSGMELCGAVPSPKEYITQILVPRYRRVDGLRVVSVEELTDVTRELHEAMAEYTRRSALEGIETRYGAARARLEYVLPQSNNVTIEEDLYCVLEVTWSPRGNAMAVQAGMPDTQWWLIRPVATYCFIAPKGQLRQATPVLQTIYSSIRITEKWFAYTEQILAFIRQKNLDDAKMIAATQAEINESQRSVLAERWDQQDRVARTNGHLLAGTMPYADPNKPDGPKVVLEQKYDHWVNDDGSIFSSPDSSITPEGPGWRKMKTAYP